MKHVSKTITYTSRRGQELILVLAALWELGSRNSKRETISFINQSVSNYGVSPRIHNLLA
jgi:hypothetical protein